MKTKKNALVLSMLAVISTPSWATGETGEINFIGSIHAGGCEVGVSVADSVTTGLSGDNIVIQLAPVEASEFTAIGVAGKPSSFSVDVDNCAPSNITLALVGDFTASRVSAKGSDGEVRTDMSFEIKGATDGYTPATHNWATETLSATLDPANPPVDGYQFPMSVEYFSEENTAPLAGIVRGSLTYLVSYD